MRSGRGSEPYERLFVRFSDPVERWIIRILLSLVVLLLVAQAALCNSAVRRVVTKVERLEGSPISQNLSDLSGGTFANNE